MKTLSTFSIKHQQQFAKHYKLPQLTKVMRETSLSHMDKGWLLEAQRNFDVEEIVTGSFPQVPRHKIIHRRKIDKNLAIVRVWG